MPKKYPVEGDFRRIVVVGNTGSGKTTLAGQLATLLGVPHVELDALHWWEPNWVPPPVEEFRARVAAALAAGSTKKSGQRESNPCVQLGKLTCHHNILPAW